MKTLDFSIYSRIKKWFNPESPAFTTRLSLLVCVFLSFSGIIIGGIEGSLAVQINGLISGIDVLNSALFLTAVNQSVRSPDYVFNYGYGKYESISILAAAGLLIIVLGYTIYEAIMNFGSTPTEGGNYITLVSFSLISLGLMRGMYILQRKASKRYHMPILAYDAEIWKVDAFLEIGVLFNLAIGTVLVYFGLYYIALVIDSSAALLLTLFALKVPLKGSRDALNQLLDKTISEKAQFEILGVVSENLSQMCEFQAVHTRQSGKDIFIEIDVILPREYSLEKAKELEVQVSRSLKQLYPTSVPRLYVTPCAGDCETHGSSNCPIKNAWFEELQKRRQS